MSASVIIVLYLSFVLSAQGTKIYQCPEYFLFEYIFVKKRKSQQHIEPPTMVKHNSKKEKSEQLVKGLSMNWDNVTELFQCQRYQRNYSDSRALPHVRFPGQLF